MTTPDPTLPALPYEAQPLKPAQLDREQRGLLLDVQLALAAIIAENQTPAGAPVQLWARPDQRRSGRLMLIEGGRGSGKTSLLLTLLDRWAQARGAPAAPLKHPAEALKPPATLAARAEVSDESPWLDADLARRVLALPQLDFDPMPGGLPLVAWVLQALRPLVLAAQGGCAAPRTLAERDAAAAPQALAQQWARLVDDAIHAWEQETGAGLSFAERTDEDRQRLRSWDRFEDRFRAAVDALFAQLDARPGAVGGPCDLVVLPIDDVDMQVGRSPELLHAVRLLRHDRLVFLCTGHRALLEETSQAKVEGELAALRGASPWTIPRPKQGGEETRRVSGVDGLGAQLVQKMFPAQHTFPRRALGLREALRVLGTLGIKGSPWQGARERFLERAKALSAGADALWALSLRDLRDLAHWLERPAPVAPLETTDPAETAAAQVDWLLVNLGALTREGSGKVDLPVLDLGGVREAFLSLLLGDEPANRAVWWRLPNPASYWDEDGSVVRWVERLEPEVHFVSRVRADWQDLLVAWSEERASAGAAPLLTEKGVVNGDSATHSLLIGGVADRAGDGVVRHWPLFTELYTKLQEVRYTRALAGALGRWAREAGDAEGKKGSVHEVLVRGWLWAHTAGEEHVAGHPDPLIAGLPPELNDLVMVSVETILVSVLLAHPTFGLGHRTRARLSERLLREVFDSNSVEWRFGAFGHAVLPTLAERLPKGAFAQADPWTSPGAHFAHSTWGHEWWWRLKLGLLHGAGAWALHRFYQNESPFTFAAVEPYPRRDRSTISLRQQLCQPESKQAPTGLMLSPAVELSALWWRDRDTDRAARWEALLWCPTGLMTTAAWVLEAWSLACAAEGLSAWAEHLSISPDGQELSYSGPAVTLSWAFAKSDRQKLHPQWAVTLGADGDPKSAEAPTRGTKLWNQPPATAAPAQLVPGSALVGLLGLLVDLLTDAKGEPHERLRLAAPLFDDHSTPLNALGVPPLRSFFAASALLTWRNEVLLSDPNVQVDDPAAQPELLSRWVEAAHWAWQLMPGTERPGRPETTLVPAQRLEGPLHWLGRFVVPTPDSVRGFAVWLLGTEDVLRKHLSPNVLSRWEQAAAAPRAALTPKA